MALRTTRRRTTTMIKPISITKISLGLSSSSSSWFLSLLSLLLLSSFFPKNVFMVVESCSDILLTPGATQDGSAMIAYNADDVGLYGVLYHYPATEGKGNEMLSVYDWDTGKYLGQIPQVDTTYNVVGNGNEYGLVIGESTFGGVSILANQPDAIIDYGSLIYITLQRSKTAREAIQQMSHLMDTYGYASSGESISIADASGEVWIMEVIGRGGGDGNGNDNNSNSNNNNKNNPIKPYGKKGAVWVAQKVPNGYITAHANQARITTFPRDKPEECLYAPDVVDVAVHYGLYPADKPAEEFSFSDVYDPIHFENARFSEARVWSIFSQVADDDGTFQEQYKDYALGRNFSNRMPLFIKPYKQLSLFDVTRLMNSHYEGTELDSTKDVGSGVFATPHRPRPLVWEYEGTKYHNERNVATERTGWNFIAQIRPESVVMPRELSTILWFAVDDSSTSPRVPVYTSSTMIAPPYQGKGTQDGVPGPLLKFTMEKAFWVQNMVSNFCYWRWKDAYPMVREKIDKIHHDFEKHIQKTDEMALKIYNHIDDDDDDYGNYDGPAKAIEYVTLESVAACNWLHQKWTEFYGELFVRFRDYSTIIPKEDNTRCGCEVQEPGLSEVVKKRIIDETGDHYKVFDDDDKVGKKQRLGAAAPEEVNTILSYQEKSIY